MRKFLGTLATLALLAALTPAQQRDENASRFEPAEVVSTAELYYPPNSIAFGTVVLQLALDSYGSIEDIKAVKDIKSLTPEAIKCVRKWRFMPAKLDGKPVRSTMVVAFTFNNPYRLYYR